MGRELKPKRKKDTTMMKERLNLAVVLELEPEQLITESNIRSKLEGIEELAASIKEKGQVTPGTVYRNENETFTIETGHRRAEACRMAGVPFRAVETDRHDEDDRNERQLVENEDRAGLTAEDRERIVSKMVEKYGSQAEVSRRLGKSEMWVSDAVRAVKLRTSVGKFPQNAPTAAILATKGVPEEKLESVIKEAQDSGGTVQAFRKASKKAKSPKGLKRPVATPQAPEQKTEKKPRTGALIEDLQGPAEIPENPLTIEREIDRVAAEIEQEISRVLSEFTGEKASPAFHRLATVLRKSAESLERSGTTPNPATPNPAPAAPASDNPAGNPAADNPEEPEVVVEDLGEKAELDIF